MSELDYKQAFLEYERDRAERAGPSQEERDAQEESENLRVWKGLEETEAHAKRLMERRQQLFVQLVVAAGRSSDPVVRGLVNRMDEVQQELKDVT